MSEMKRVQGRPVRGVGDVGRERLVEAARSLLQVKIPQTLSRKAVADAAGVTPALVSYYFPDKAVLVSAATRPLVAQRIAEIEAVLSSTDSHHARLRRLVELMVALSESEAHLVDLTLDAFRRDATDPVQRSLLLLAYGQFKHFVQDGVAAGAWRSLDPDTVLCALFGMCRAFCNVETGEHPQGLATQVDRIVEFALHGLQPDRETTLSEAS